MVRNTHDFVDDHHDIDGLVTALAAEGLVSGVTVQDEGSPLTGLGTTLNFAGAGVAATGSGATKTITISGGGGGSGVDVEDDGTPLTTTATTLNFTGTGVTASGSGTTKTINIPGGGGGGFGIGRDTSVIQNECFFNSSLVQYDGAISASVSGTSAAITAQSAQETGHPGIFRGTTGSTSTGRAAITSSADRQTGDGQVTFGCIARLVNLSDGSQTYTAQMGLTLSTSTVDSDEVVAFRYTHGSLSGNWGGSTRHFSVTTALADLGVAADTSWHCFEFVLLEDCSSVEWFIDGSSVGTSSTGIPPAGTDIRTTPFMINKSVGGTAREFLMDAYWYHYEFGTSR